MTTVTYTPVTANSPTTWDNSASATITNLKNLLIDGNGGYILDANNTRIILGGDYAAPTTVNSVGFVPSSNSVATTWTAAS